MRPPVWERLGIPKPPGWLDPYRHPTTYAARHKRPLIFRSEVSLKPWLCVIPPGMYNWGERIERFHDTHAEAIAYAHRFATAYHQTRKEVEPCR